MIIRHYAWCYIANATVLNFIINLVLNCYITDLCALADTWLDHTDKTKTKAIPPCHIIISIAGLWRQEHFRNLCVWFACQTCYQDLSIPLLSCIEQEHFLLLKRHLSGVLKTSRCLDGEKWLLNFLMILRSTDCYLRANIKRRQVTRETM